jgi:YVTN family beta-propeller protein
MHPFNGESAVCAIVESSNPNRALRQTLEKSTASSKVQQTSVCSGAAMDRRLSLRPACLVAGLAVLASPLATTDASTLVVANKAEATVSLIDLDSASVVATLPTGVGPHEVGISPDGRFAMVTNYGNREASGNSLTMIDIGAAAVVKTIDLGEYLSPHGVEWIDSGTIAVTAEDNKALLVIDVATEEIISAIDTDQDVSHMLSLAQDGKRAYVTNIGSGSLTVIDLESGERVANIPTGKGAEGIAVSGKQIWVTNRGEDTISILGTESLEVAAEINSSGFPIRATATPQGYVLVTRADAGDMVIYDTKNLQELRTVVFDLESMDVDGRLFGDRFGDSSVPIGVVVDETGQRAFVAHANADVITEIDLESGEIVRPLMAGKEPDGMGWSPVVAGR